MTASICFAVIMFVSYECIAERDMVLTSYGQDQDLSELFEESAVVQISSHSEAD
jgi:hypothetical protein